jgi:hypothetical protein
MAFLSGVHFSYQLTLYVNCVQPLKANTYTFAIAENVPVASVVGSVAATDADQDHFGKDLLRFSLATEGNVDSRFAIDAITGAVSTASVVDGTNAEVALDREDRAQYTLRCIVTDSGSGAFVQANVIVNIEDTNDNGPSYVTATITKTINEEYAINHVVFSMAANDADLLTFGDLNYRIESNAQVPFGVVADNGDVFVTEQIDFEEDTLSYDFTVYASENNAAARETSIDVTVLIADINDNAPLFNSTVEALETVYTRRYTNNNNAGTDITTVSATDADDASNAVFEFSITGGNTDDFFRIDNTSGLIELNKPANRGTHASFELQVTATDHGTPPNKADTTINIAVSMFPMFPETVLKVRCAVYPEFFLVELS